jgi:outer membrane protein
MIRNYVTVFLLLVTFSVTLTEKAVSQQVLTLQEAVESGLENNFGIRISQNLQEQASNNFTVGNAGFLPSLELTASRNESIDDSEFESAGGDSQTNTGARSTTTSAALNLNWTIFDGLRMFSSYNRLGKLKDVSDELLRSDMENLVSQIALSYFNIIRISEQIKVLQNNIDVSRERIEIEEAKVDIGSGSEYDLLQARSDLNADRASLLREQNILTEAKILLNELLARDPSTDFDVTRDILVNRFLSRDELYQKLMAENVDLSIARVQREITTLEVREIRGERLPVVSLNSGYRYNRSENDGGFFRFNETTGFSFGVTARVNIFDGFNTSRRVQNAQINQKNAELTLESQKLRLESEFLALFRAYQNSIELVDLEEENLLNAEETLDIALERFRLGSISSLEFREAQRTFLAAENRLISAKFDAKVAETELLRLSGELDTLLAQE